MLDGSVLYTPMYYNPRASDCILSPEAICHASSGLLESWCQSGSLSDGIGSVSMFDHTGACRICLQLNKHNGLYYSTISTIALDKGPSYEPRSGNRTVYFHDDDSSDADVSLEVDPSNAAFLRDLSTSDPRRQQIEADLWQARLGHCSEWQLKVLPAAADGLPAEFTPHPFASYDHYNHARIRKMPATKGKHPSRATTKQQRFFMDFGFLRASNFDYSRPEKSTDRVITSFDGYSSYLIVVDEYTKFIWVFLCKTKEPPMILLHLFLDLFGSKAGGSIRCDQGGELAQSHEFVTQMILRKYSVEPTGADNASQNKAVEKWNDVLGVTVRVLLYGSGLPATFWSVALLHAVYLHNRRVHRSIMMTPYEAWHGFKPDLRKLRVFGLRVCVKRTGKRRSKLNRHDFTGIFLGYTATDENIRYVDVDSRCVKQCHHVIFDEAWYLQPRRPPFAQMLYDVGLDAPAESPIGALPLGPPPKATYPPMCKPPPLPLRACHAPLPLRMSETPLHFLHAAAAKTATEVLPSDMDLMGPISTNKRVPLDQEMMAKHDITSRDMAMVSCLLPLFMTLLKRSSNSGILIRTDILPQEWCALNVMAVFIWLTSMPAHQQPKYGLGVLASVVHGSSNSMTSSSPPSWMFNVHYSHVPTPRPNSAPC